MTFGQRLADRIARFGGSWTFLLFFSGFIAFWIGINSGVFLLRTIDPYPFILLNLMLSCLAAIQAPIIMISQNRQAELDRQRLQRIEAKLSHLINVLEKPNDIKIPPR